MVVSRLLAIVVSCNNDTIAVANARLVNAMVYLFEGPPENFYNAI